MPKEATVSHSNKKEDYRFRKRNSACGQLGLGYPDAVHDAVADLKNVLMAGQFFDAKVAMIENLQVNIIKSHIDT